MTENDGRVSLAVISNQIENIQEDVIEINGKIDNSTGQLNDLNIKMAVVETGQDNFDNIIEGLQQKSNRNDAFVMVGNMFMLAVASAANYLGLRK